MNFFSEYGFYDKIIGTLKLIERGQDTKQIFAYFKIEEPSLFKTHEDMEKKLVNKLFIETLQFIERKEDSLVLTEDGIIILDNHKTGEVSYNKQLVFLYLARNTGGFLNIFYSLREGGRIDRDEIITKVNSEREKEEFPPRKRWRDFQERLTWFQELGIVKEFDDGKYMLTYSGKQLFARMQKKKSEVGPDINDELAGMDQEPEIENKTLPVNTLNQLPKEHRDRTTGKINTRRFGIRIDDDVIVYIVGGDTLRVIEGRVLHHKSGLHLVDTDGYYHRISYDWVTDIVIKKHNRPHPKDDKERISRKKRKTKTAKPKEPDTLNTAYL
jgi:hypothetical protein